MAPEILRNAVKNKGSARAPLGSRLAARFAGLGLTQDIPELRGELARPTNPESAGLDFQRSPHL